MRQGDVFVSASPSVNQTLMGPSNGDWVSWYVTFANSPLVIGYNPHSKFAADLKTKPWYEVITEPGFLMGRTDPKTDPKGKLADMALAQAAKMYNLPALNAIVVGDGQCLPGGDPGRPAPGRAARRRVLLHQRDHGGGNSDRGPDRAWPLRPPTPRRC